MDAQSFSGDELFSAWLMEMGFGDMLDTVPESEATPPVFYVLEWLAVQLFGTGEVGMRLLPALCGVLTVPALYLTGALAASRRVGLAAAALAAVNPLLVWYSQEARAYAPMILLVAISLACLAAVARGGGRRWAVGWAVASAAALATHYFAAFVVMAGALWLLRSRAHDLRTRLAAVAVPSAVGLALVPLALHQSEAVGDEGAVGPGSLLERLAAIPKSFLVGYSLPAEAVVVIAVALLAAAALVLAARSEGDERRTARLAAIAAAFGILVPLAIAPFGLDYLASKNVVAAIVPSVIVFACGLAAGRLGLAALAALAALSVATVIGVAANKAYQRADYRGAAAALGEPRGERMVIFNPAFSNPGPFGVYFGKSEPVRRDYPALVEVAVVALNQQGGFGPSHPEPPTAPAKPPPPGFRLAEDRRTDSYRLIRYTAARPTRVEDGHLGLVSFPGLPQATVLQRARTGG
ncbi:MAG TPA: glycosyltransferase family 39 protein [Thermoleophilaceae bacterium]